MVCHSPYSPARLVNLNGQQSFEMPTPRYTGSFSLQTPNLQQQISEIEKEFQKTLDQFNSPSINTSIETFKKDLKKTEISLQKVLQKDHSSSQAILDQQEKLLGKTKSFAEAAFAKFQAKMQKKIDLLELEKATRQKNIAKLQAELELSKQLPNLDAILSQQEKRLAQLELFSCDEFNKMNHDIFSAILFNEPMYILTHSQDIFSLDTTSKKTTISPFLPFSNKIHWDLINECIILNHSSLTLIPPNLSDPVTSHQLVKNQFCNEFLKRIQELLTKKSDSSKNLEKLQSDFLVWISTYKIQDQTGRMISLIHEPSS